MRMGKTIRGFARAEFVDRYGNRCSLQKSSIATEDCVWLGVDIPFDCFKEGRDPPKEVTRMHLTRKGAKEIMRHLVRFIETGELDPVLARERRRG